MQELILNHPKRATQFVVRLPLGMRDSIRDRALENRRSMNAEIVHYIDRALREEVGAAEVAASPRPGHSVSLAGENK